MLLTIAGPALGLELLYYAGLGHRAWLGLSALVVRPRLPPRSAAHAPATGLA